MGYNFEELNINYDMDRKRMQNNLEKKDSELNTDVEKDMKELNVWFWKFFNWKERVS